MLIKEVFLVSRKINGQYCPVIIFDTMDKARMYTLDNDPGQDSEYVIDMVEYWV